MTIGRLGQAIGGALASPCTSPNRSRPGAVAMRSLPRKKAGTPAKPGTVTMKRRLIRFAARCASRSSARRGS